MVLMQLVNRFSKTIRETVRLFSSEEKGAIAVYVALFFATLVTCSGVYIDYHRSRSASNEMQLALDRAVLLAARKTLAGTGGSRQEIAKDVFKGGLFPKTREYWENYTSPANFVLNIETEGSEEKFIHAEARATVPLFFGRMLGRPEWTVAVQSRATIAAGEIRQGDFVFVIDATSSMQDTINSVKDHAVTFRDEFNTALIAGGLEPLDGMRIRVVFFRDFLAQYTLTDINAMNARAGNLCDDTCKEDLLGRDADNNFNPVGIYMGQREFPYGAVVASDFFDLDDMNGPDEFRDFVQNVPALGGGDYPEFGLQGLSEALNSIWLNPGDTTPHFTGAIQKTFKIVVLWTDQTAYPLPDALTSGGTVNSPDPTLGDPINGASPNKRYLAWNGSGIWDWNVASNMPEDYAGLIQKWENIRGTGIETFFITFMPQQVFESSTSLRTPYHCANYVKATVACPNGYFYTFGDGATGAFREDHTRGGTVEDGNTSMIETLVEKISEKIDPPRLVMMPTPPPPTP